METNGKKSIATLCICIPTYNKLPLLRKLIENILNSDLYEIRILIVDNHSSDGTIEFLQSIVDERVMIITSDNNIGGNQNILKAITSDTNAEYNLLLLDRDVIHNYVIKHLVLFLKEKTDIDVGRIFYKNSTHSVNFKLAKSSKIEDYFNLVKLYKFNHPTGYIFSRSYIIENKRLLLDFFDYNNKLLYPITKFILDSVRRHPPLIINYPNKYYINVESEMVKWRSGFLIKYSKIPMLDVKLNFSEIEHQLIRMREVDGFVVRFLLILKLYSYANYKFTIIAKKTYLNSNYSRHYGMEPTLLSNQELLNRHYLFKKLFKKSLFDVFPKKKLPLIFVLSIIDLRIKMIIFLPIIERFKLNPTVYIRWVLRKVSNL